MATIELTEKQSSNALRGLEELIRRGATQTSLADSWGTTQQAVSSARAKGRASAALAICVARSLGVDVLGLIDEGRLEPLPGEGTRMASLAAWGPALQEATKQFGERIPDWCWEQAGEWITRSPPQRVTPLAVWNLAEAIWNNATPAERERDDTEHHRRSVAKRPRVTVEKVVSTFAGEPSKEMVVRPSTIVTSARKTTPK